VAGIRAALAVYSGLHCILLYTYQFDVVNDSFGPTAPALGLVAFFNQSASLNPLEFNPATLEWPAWCYPFVLAVLYVVAASPFRNPRAAGPWWWRGGVAVQVPYELVAADEYTPLISSAEPEHSRSRSDSTSSLASTFSQQGRRRDRLIGVIVGALHTTHYAASLAAMLLWALGYPSWLVLPLLLWSCVAWILFPRAFLPTTPILVVYAVLMLALEFIYVVPGSPLQQYDLSSVGMVPTDLSDIALAIAAKLLALALFCYSCRHNHEGFRLPGPQDQQAPDGHLPAEQSRHISTSTASKVWRHLARAAGILANGLLRYSFAIALLVLYVAALDEVNVLNSVYVAALPVFAAFPSVRERFWMLLVLYCECVIVTFFLWGFPFTDYVPEATTRMLGMEAAEGHQRLLYNLRWHIAIFTFSVIQLLAYRFFAITWSSHTAKSAAVTRQASLGSSYQMVPSEAATLDAEVTTPDAEVEDEAGVMVEQRATQETGTMEALERFVRDVWFLVAPLILLLVGILAPVSLLKLGYLALLFAIAIFLQLGLLKLYHGAWVVVVIYAGSVQMLKYIYQFEQLRVLVDKHVGQQWIKASGFVVIESQKDLFVYLVSE